MSTFNVSFTVRADVAKQGVYAAVFGQADNTQPTAQFLYLTQSSLPSATTSEPSTQTTGTVAPTSTTLAVNSVAGFPTSGSLVVIQPGLEIELTYTGVDSTTNTFTGIAFPSGAPGLAKGALITVVDVTAGTTLSVTDVTGFPTSGTLLVQTPSSYTPSGNAVISYTGMDTNANSFTGVTKLLGGAIPGGGSVNLISQPGNAMTYATPVANTNLPLIQISAPKSGKATVSFDLPDYTTSPVKSGVMVISVGSAIGLPVAADGSVGSPTPATNLNDIFGLFEWGLNSNDVDFDVSEVDQAGFPFQVTSVGVAPPPPADPVLGVGMLLKRDALFTGFKTFINGLSTSSNAGVFLEGAADNADAPFPINTRIIAPQDIVSVLQADAPVVSSPFATGSGTGSGATVYYAVTAVSANGESMASNVVMGIDGTGSLEFQWLPYPYAESYNVYWASSAQGTPPVLSNPQLIAQKITGTSYTDTSPGTHTGNRVTPPANNYAYDPLNAYFDQALLDFFSYYASNEFVLDDQATATKWTGKVSTSNGYTILALTGSAGQWGSQYSGDVLELYQPLFNSNSNNTSYPAPPSWLTTSTAESASSMIFAADGIFGDVVSANTTLPVGEAKNLYNNFVSAFSRGITVRKRGGVWSNNLPPNYWAGSPLLQSATASGSGSLNGTYRYAISAVGYLASTTSGTVTGASNANPIVITAANNGLQSGDLVTIAGVTGNTKANGTFAVTVIDANTFSIPATGNGSFGGTPTWTLATETTPSNIQEVAATSSSVTLAWGSINPPGGVTGAATAFGFNIYRAEKSGSTWGPLMKLDFATNLGTDPANSYVDNGSKTPSGAPSFSYYPDGQLANFYAAYWSQLDVSINGLGYGFPYADKNGQSTNIQMAMSPNPPTGLSITLLSWS